MRSATRFWKLSARSRACSASAGLRSPGAGFGRISFSFIVGEPGSGAEHEPVVDVADSGRRPGCRDRLVVLLPRANGALEEDGAAPGLDRDLVGVEPGVALVGAPDRVLDLVRVGRAADQGDLV